MSQSHALSNTAPTANAMRFQLLSPSAHWRFDGKIGVKNEANKTCIDCSAK